MNFIPPETRCVKSDGMHIAYQVLGEGPLDVVFVPGFVSNVEANWASPARSSLFRRLSSFCRLILFDKRGTGMSDRTSQVFSLEQHMHDVQAVMDDVHQLTQRDAWPKVTFSNRRCSCWNNAGISANGLIHLLTCR